eukprot:16235420-Heterocapsa_arctica.AAC.1
MGIREAQGTRSTRRRKRTGTSRTWQGDGFTPTRTSGTASGHHAGEGISISSTTTCPRGTTRERQASPAAPSRRRTTSGKDSGIPSREAQRRKDIRRSSTSRGSEERSAKSGRRRKAAKATTARP